MEKASRKGCFTLTSRWSCSLWVALFGFFWWEKKPAGIGAKENLRKKVSPKSYLFHLLSNLRPVSDNPVVTSKVAKKGQKVPTNSQYDEKLQKYQILSNNVAKCLRQKKITDDFQSKLGTWRLDDVSDIPNSLYQKKSQNYNPKKNPKLRHQNNISRLKYYRRAVVFISD